MGNSLGTRYATSDHFKELASNSARRAAFVQAVQRHAQCDAYISALTAPASSTADSGEVAMSPEERDALQARVRATQTLFSAGIVESRAKVCCSTPGVVTMCIRRSLAVLLWLLWLLLCRM